MSKNASGRLRRTLLTLLTAVALATSGCADAGEEVEVGGEGSPGGSDGGLFVSVEVGGGFSPVGADFRQPPTATVYADGTVFAPGAITLQYPGPAILPVFTGSIAQPEIDEILAAAEEAGLTEERSEWGDPPVADAPTTTITVVVDGEARVNSIYALGSEGGPPGAPGQAEGDSEGARQQAQDFVDLVSSKVTESAQEQYEPDRYRVLPIEPGTGPQPDPAVQPQSRDWPYPDLTLEPFRCVAVTGDRATQFGEALAESSEITLWRTESGEEFFLSVRATLPHEPDCPPETDSDDPGSGEPEPNPGS